MHRVQVHLSFNKNTLSDLVIDFPNIHLPYVTITQSEKLKLAQGLRLIDLLLLQLVQECGLFLACISFIIFTCH